MTDKQYKNIVIEREDGRDQSALILRDVKGREKSRTKTQPDGTFVFDNLTPGNYVLFCIKPDSLRRATVPALVEPNKTTVRNVELSL